VPDKSGELLTQDGARQFIDELKKKIEERDPTSVGAKG
jgi:hypothetical protein